MNPVNLNLALLERLTQTPGLPGREGAVAGVIQETLAGTAWDARTDRLGNVIAHLPGAGPKILLVAHMDEVGLLVRRITDEGFLQVERLGGMGVYSLPGNWLTVWTQQGPLPAAVGVLPQHFISQATLPDIAEIYIDIGARSRQEALEMGVRPGDGLTWAPSFHPLSNERVSSKALDDRLGCLVLLEFAQKMSPQNLGVDLWLAFVVQEETALSGGVPVIETVQPDVVIGVDGTLTFDTPDLAGAQSDVRLGGWACAQVDGCHPRQAGRLRARSGLGAAGPNRGRGRRGHPAG